MKEVTMALNIHRLGRTFAAQVRGVDLRRTLGDADVDAIDQALAEEGVLVFRQMPLTDDQQQAFIERFGPPSEVKLDELKSAKSAHPHFFDVTTVEDDGSKLDPNSARAMYLRANLLWHTDGSQAQPPIRLTALSARRLPSAPPDTEYADMRAAYDDLSDAMKVRIDEMKVEHSIFYSRAKMGMTTSDWTADAMRKRPPVIHPLVRTHPRTGRKALYLASHASHVIGLPVEEGRALIDALTAHATQPRYVYAHNWQPHDLVMWDDTWTMHRAVPYEADEPRVLRWSGVRETAPV
jgi:alpha-ketoglutarate-dependent 2,4-dichlorophenoxyacetate dioxygenase